MKIYPYQSLSIEDRNLRTTYIVKSPEALSESDVALAIADPTLDRTGWASVHPLLRVRWTFVEIFAPAGFATATAEAVPA